MGVSRPTPRRRLRDLARGECVGPEPGGRLGVWPEGCLGPLRQTPPPLQTATAADGTHPTGMHSCFFFHFIFV